MAVKEKTPKSRAHKESQGQRRGARKVRLTELEKFLISGKKPSKVIKSGKNAQLHNEEEAKKQFKERQQKKTGHDAFQKLAGRR